MYTIGEIVYSGEPKAILKVNKIVAKDDYLLYVEFNDGSKNDVDFKKFLKLPVFEPLNDYATFSSVYLDCGVPTWKVNGGVIDIAPEALSANP